MVDLTAVNPMNTSKGMFYWLNGSVRAYKPHIIIAYFHFPKIPFHVIAIVNEFVIIKKNVILSLYRQ